MLAPGIIKWMMNKGLLFTTNLFVVFFLIERYISPDTEFWSLFVCLFFFLFLSSDDIYYWLENNIFNDKQTNAILKSTTGRNEQVQHNEYMNKNWSSEVGLDFLTLSGSGNVWLHLPQNGLTTPAAVSRNISK